jgi:putative membrane protein
MNYYQTIPHFIAYFFTAIALAVVFITAYAMITPNKEFKLIHEGNLAVAVQLVGTFIGFVVPMAFVIGNSVNLLDVVLWGIVALFVQVVTFLTIVKIFKGISDRLAEDCFSSGVFIGGISLGVGILQAACMIP